MKLGLVVAAAALTCSHGFVVSTNSPRALTGSPPLQMGGFLEGKGKKNEIMKNEDEAMWVDDGSESSSSGGWNPFKIAASLDDIDLNKPRTTGKPGARKPAIAKAPAAKKEPKKASGGFKFPWDK